MANDLTGNPLSVDTASATALLTGVFQIMALRWVSKAASAGDDIQVQDKNGRVIWESVASGSNYVEAHHWPHDSPLPTHGLLVPTLDSGTLYIYTKNPAPRS